MAFLLSIAFTDQFSMKFRSGYFVAGILGFILCIPWLSTYYRAHAFYSFRMAQARHLEPHGLKLLDEDGRNFSNGREIEIDGEPYQLSWLAKNLRVQVAIPILIYLL